MAYLKLVCLVFLIAGAAHAAPSLPQEEEPIGEVQVSKSSA